MDGIKRRESLDESSTGARHRRALDRLTGNSAEFLAAYWRKDCHLFSAPTGSDALLDLDAFDSLVTQHGLRSPMVWVMGGGEQREPSQLTTTTDGTRMVEGLVVPEDVGSELAGGKTVSLRGLNHFWPPVGAITRQLELDLMHPVHSNAYLTPARMRGLALHHDSHDVFVVQTHGEKVWEVFRSREPNPMAPWNPATDEPGELVGEFVLRAGDCLYIPLGFPHRARTQNQPSLHVTLGVDVKRWVDAFEALCTFAMSASAFREPLPPDFPLDPRQFRERLLSRLQLLLLWASDETLTEPLLDRLWSRGRPPLDGHVADMLVLADLCDDTLVAWRRDQVWDLGEENGAVVLSLWNQVLTLPARFARSLATLVDAAEVRVADVDPDLGADERLELVRRLVSAGILRVMRGGAAHRADG